MFIVSQELTDYRSINVIETETAWTSSSSVSAYDIFVYEKYYWKAVIDDPPSAPSESSVNWVKWGISNKYAAIDEKANTATMCDVDTIVGGSSPYTMVVELTWGVYDTLVISGAVASSISIKLSLIGDPTYADPEWTYSQDADYRTCAVDWLNYYNVNRQCEIESIDDRMNVFVRPPLISGIMQITLEQSSKFAYSTAGIIYAGYGYDIGCTGYPVGIGLDDYSKHTPDDYGTMVLVKRQSRRTRKLQVWVEKIDVLRIEEYVKEFVLGNVVLFVGDESEDSIFYNLITLGFIEKFKAGLSVGDKEAIEFDIKEMI